MAIVEVVRHIPGCIVVEIETQSSRRSTSNSAKVARNGYGRCRIIFSVVRSSHGAQSGE